MDGTLIDSMGYWKGLAEEYLKNKGVETIPSGVLEQIKPMTMTEAAALFIQTFRLKGTPETIAAEMNAMMDAHYREDIPLKNGVLDYLEQLKRSDVTMCVASATALPLMKACLQRLHAEHYFSFLLSCEEVGAGKNKPDVYFAATARLNAEPEEIAVFEDALYAAKTAKEAGFYVVGVFDESIGDRWYKMEVLADETKINW